MTLSLAAAFFSAHPARADVPAIDALELQLNGIVKCARQTWPTIAGLSDTTFVEHVSARVRPNERIDAGLERMHLDDLYLACACAHEIPRAIELVTTHVIAPLRASLLRANIPASIAQDVEQAASERLFVKTDASRAKIDEYDASGPLRSWIRVILMRDAFHAIERRGREVEWSDAALDFPATHDDPELAHLKVVYRREYAEAFADAMAKLGDRRRRILREHLVLAMSIDQLGALHQVHRSTAARWVEHARSDLLKATRQSLMRQLKISRPELDSIMRLIESNIEVSVKRLLGGE